MRTASSRPAASQVGLEWADWSQAARPLAAEEQEVAEMEEEVAGLDDTHQQVKSALTDERALQDTLDRERTRLNEETERKTKQEKALLEHHRSTSPSPRCR